MRVPLFPLPTAVLFPKAFMPLHIFEPRYRAMLADALAGSRRIAMGLLAKTGDAVHGVCGVGVIVKHEPLPDGRSNILLMGEARARIVSQEQAGPYLKVKVERLREVHPGPDAAEAPTRCLTALLKQSFSARFPGEGERLLDEVLKRKPGLGTLADFAASILLQEPLQRQELLETLDVLARSERLSVLLGANPIDRAARSLLEVRGASLN